MHRFSTTRDVLAQVEEFKEYKENRQNASRKERDFDEVIFRYLMEYILFVFDGEADRLQQDMLKYCTEKIRGNGMSNKAIKRKLNESLQSVLNGKDQLPRMYDTFIENRNQAAHPRQAIFVTWEEFVNIKLQDNPTEEVNIAHIGERMLFLIKNELDKSIQEGNN